MRLDAFADYCNEIRALPILIIPGSNDGSFEPNRSVLDGSTRADARYKFEQDFQAVRAAEATDPEASIAGYIRLAKQHPEFAETHFRLARLLAAAGKWNEAKSHFVLARDLDGFLLRCPSTLQEAYRTVARHGALLVDSPRVLDRVAPHEILDDFLFHDAQHPNLRGIVALANDALAQLKERRAFNWPESIPAPRVDINECAQHFNLDARKWSEICRRSASFYFRTATVRFDPSDRERVCEEYERAAVAIDAGRPPLESDNPNIALAARLAESWRTDGAGRSAPRSNGCGDD